MTWLCWSTGGVKLWKCIPENTENSYSFHQHNTSIVPYSAALTLLFSHEYFSFQSLINTSGSYFAFFWSMLKLRPHHIWEFISVFPSHGSLHLLLSYQGDVLLTPVRKTNSSRPCRDVFWLFRGGRCVWELHLCSISGLWAVVCSVRVSSVPFSFCLWLLLIFLTVASLQGVAQDFMLSCNHCLTLSFFCYFSVLLKSPAASTALQPPLPPPVSLLWFCITVVLLFFGVILWVFLLFVDLLSFWLSDTPSPLPAVRYLMVQCCACLQFCGWSVGPSPVHVKFCQLVLCCGLSSEWTMCIKLCKQLLVWQWFIPTFKMSKCHIEIMLFWNWFPFSRIWCGGLLIMNHRVKQLHWQWSW